MKIQVSESVGLGHPDKIADVIADKLLEVVLEKDIRAQFACEVLTSQNLIVVAGELTTSYKEKLDVEGIVGEILLNLGYEVSRFSIVSNLKEQSLDIRSTSIEGGIVSGDQSVVLGCASNETTNYMPLAFNVATDLTRTLNNCIRNKEIVGGKYDCKSLVVIEDKKIKTLILSVQHDIDVDLGLFKEELYRKVVLPSLNKYSLVFDKSDLLINQSGKFVIGGLDADTGLTNRKLIVDSYGTSVRHGGGGYSGKDLTKVDRLGAYYARWICKNIVAAGLCSYLELELVFHYGSAEPLIIIKNTDSLHDLKSIIPKVFPIKFAEIYELFNKPIKYSKLACYGHFGREELDLPWEKLDMVDKLKSIL
ncbi:S-adenosylmethionine synthase [Candidatus Mycoplasma haematohominis]|uniref:Methionine adenosyltransferase n=1 Tax=Candidatus Mycoplasma haematohominis TaxID=1494318 RepID=A0A478FS11_9MOLU|nr:S-adenosylmethionine synthase [Candidatus Mycoplasma haemohominis]